MSAAASNHPHDPLGLDAPFAEGRDEADRFETGADWRESGESPYAESPYAESIAVEGYADSGERLAWLDVEAERGDAASSEGFVPHDEDLHEDLYENPGEAQEHERVSESGGGVEAEAGMEFLDDEERDAFESAEAHAESEDRFEPEAGNPNAPLTAQQRAWILALDRSAIERVADTTLRERFLQQDWSDIEFPGNVPKGQTATAAIKQHWVLSRSLFNAMAGVVPERRVPSSIRFRERATAKVPGQDSQRLYPEARDAFVRMHAAARADGVDLVILSSWRSRARQAAASANQPNPNAVARKASAHMYGLAIDVRMAVPGLPVKEINTRVDRATAARAGTSAKMGNLVRMYRSPVYKWLSLRASEFGWFPYRNEPWHWEYNPPGLKARFEAATRGELEGEAVAGSPPAWSEDEGESPYTEAEYEPTREAAFRDEGEDESEADASSGLRTFTASALPVKLAVYVTQAARRAGSVEMLVFAHGLDLCKPVLKNRPASFVTGAPFKLGELVEASGRPIVLVVPFLDWERLASNAMAFGRKWHRLAQPDVFNRVAAEALEVARGIAGASGALALSRLILAGHSRAYGFLDALANAHATPQMRTGALSRPLHVWALDTTYSAPIADWRGWLRSREDMVATVVFRHGTYRTKASSVPRELTTGVRGRDFTRLAASSGGRMTVMPVTAGKVSHCAIPSVYLPRLLAALPPPAASGEDEHAGEMFDANEDEAGLVAEAEAEAQGEWEEEAESGISYEYENERDDENEDKYEDESQAGTPGRFDAFNDLRDTEWSSESGEELAGSFDESAPLSFEPEEEDEAGLSKSGLTPAEQKAVEITSLFETGKRGGFYGLSGNFDGQGLSFGLVNWTMGTGSLQPLLRDFARENPARWAQVFGADASRFLELIARKDKASQKRQHRFAIDEMNTRSVNARGRRVWTVRQPWVGYFRRLSEDAAFQQIQVRYVRDLLVAADGYCRQFKLTSERALCFMFDAVSSHGKWWLKKKFDGVEKRRVLVEQALQALAARYGAGRIPEADVLLAIADALATTSAQRWAEKVRTRKRWFVTGEHPRKRELQGLMPRAQVPYTTSASSREPGTSRESGEAWADEESGKADAAGDAQLILGKWTVWVQDWVWEYEFLPGGKSRWRDTRSQEKGEGRWKLTAKSVELTWIDSTTTESWPRPLAPAHQTIQYRSSYYTGASRAQKIGGAGATVPAWADAIDPFPPAMALSLDTADARLSSAFAAIPGSSVSHLCAAVAYAKDDPVPVPFATLNGDDMVFVGSMSKVAVMYAAFALRAQVRVFARKARENGITTAPELFALIKRAWSPKLRALFPSRPTRSFNIGQDITVPQVDTIFTMSASGDIEFAKATPPKTDAEFDKVRDKGAPIGLFHDWMRLMMRWSNNDAASRCILALGYFYLNGLFARNGFFAGGKGIWISGDYAKHDWVASETERLSNAAGVALTPRWATAQQRTKSNFVGNALQYGRLMAAMATGKLVDPAACVEMRALADQLSGGIRSYGGNGLIAVGRTPSALSSKIGFGDDSFSHDSLIVERTDGASGKRIRYAAVVLGAKNRQHLKDLFVLLDEAVLVRTP